MDKKIIPDLGELVEKYTEALYAWAAHKVSDPETARDLVQDTFLAAAEKLDSFKAESSPKTWLFSILNYKIIDIYRKKVHTRVNTDDETYSRFFDTYGKWQTGHLPGQWDDEGPDNNLLDDEAFQKVLQECLDALPDNWNSCIKLKYLTGKKGREICQELDITPTNYWQILHRAKLELRECIDSNWFNN
ncbi:MAG: sigma-70 family RNA polymerase sigma factor [Bacteroidales bacterium]|nr:sigma-70 family RNA polymerase sigma factor [Bacteroidales bacterium]